MLAPARSRYRLDAGSVPPIYTKGGTLYYGVIFQNGSAGAVLRSQGSSEEDGVFALCARGGFDRFQCSLQPGPAPASTRGWVVSENKNGGPALKGRTAVIEIVQEFLSQP